MTILSKKTLDKDVYTLAKERIHLLYDRFDHVVVSFSGGKDSTVCLQLALEVAKERGRLPVEAYFFDEECTSPQTVEYVDRVRQRDDVDLKWICVEVKHRNACSREEPFWYTWDRTCPEKWIRPLPDVPELVTDAPGWERGMDISDGLPFFIPLDKGTVAEIKGLRAQESLNRYMAIAHKEIDNWIGDKPKRVRASRDVDFPLVWSTCPIYDWTTEDVWKAPAKFGWDYNRTYDVFDMMGATRHQQRVAPPFGEQPIRQLHWWAKCFPEYWHKISKRVKGAATCALYNSTGLYGMQFNKDELNDFRCPDGMSWREYSYRLIQRYSDKETIPTSYGGTRRISVRSHVQGVVTNILMLHKQATDDPLPDAEKHPDSGLS